MQRILKTKPANFICAVAASSTLQYVQMYFITFINIHVQAHKMYVVSWTMDRERQKVVFCTKKEKQSLLYTEGARPFGLSKARKYSAAVAHLMS